MSGSSDTNNISELIEKKEKFIIDTLCEAFMLFVRINNGANNTEENFKQKLMEASNKIKKITNNTKDSVLEKTKAIVELINEKKKTFKQVNESNVTFKKTIKDNSETLNLLYLELKHYHYKTSQFDSKLEFELIERFYLQFHNKTILQNEINTIIFFVTQFFIMLFTKMVNNKFGFDFQPDNIQFIIILMKIINTTPSSPPPPNLSETDEAVIELLDKEERDKMFLFALFINDSYGKLILPFNKLKVKNNELVHVINHLIGDDNDDDNKASVKLNSSVYYKILMHYLVLQKEDLGNILDVGYMLVKMDSFYCKYLQSSSSYLDGDINDENHTIFFKQFIGGGDNNNDDNDDNKILTPTLIGHYVRINKKKLLEEQIAILNGISCFCSWYLTNISISPELIKMITITKKVIVCYLKSEKINII